MRRASLISAVFVTIASTTPAWANGSVALPEPSSLALFGIGAAGVALGRRLAMRKHSDRD